MKSNKEALKNDEEKKDRAKPSYCELPEEDTTPPKLTKKEIKAGKELKESWVFRKSKANKEKNDPGRFSGDGVNFKAKIIGIEVVFDARGNRMCQETLQKLKSDVKTSGEHKQRILLNISLHGIKIKDEKTLEVLHHHPVHKISFISQDSSDNRAFGYVFGCPQTGHQFFGIKTEKTASLVVCTLRDLFHTALVLKKKEIEKVMEQQQEEEVAIENGTNHHHHHHLNGQDEPKMQPHSTKETPETKYLPEDEQVYFQWSPDRNGGSEPKQVSPSCSETDRSLPTACTVDNLLDLQFEMNSLQQGITQMDYTIASAVSLGFGVSFSEDDNSISSGCSFPMTPRKLNKVSALYQETLSMSSRSSSTSDYTAYAQDGYMENFAAFKNEAFNPAPPAKENPPPPPPPPAEAVEDRYAVFYDIDSLPSVFDNPTFLQSSATSAEQLLSESSTEQTDRDSEDIGIDSFTSDGKAGPTLFAELDPLGNQPYIDRENFFHELKNPPKKVLKDLIGDSCDTQGSVFEPGPNSHLNEMEESVISEETSRNPFACVPASPPQLPPKRSFSVSSTPLPTSIVKKLENISIANDENVLAPKNPFNPFIYSEEELDVPPPNSPPPPPPPRLPVKDTEPPPVSPPPRPPSRSSAVPTPPRPRRKVPFGVASSAWFSFDQEALSSAVFSSQTSWNNEPMSPPLPVPLRKPSFSSNKFESVVQKSCSASNSPAAARRLSSLENNRILNGTVSPNRKMLSRHSSIAQDAFGDSKFVISPLKDPFPESSPIPETNGTDCAEINRILNPSPPLPPKATGISRPRPSPSCKMLSAPCNTSHSPSNSSSLGSKNESSSSSLKYGSLDETRSNLGSGSEALCPSSTGSQTDDIHSSGYNGEVSGISSENGHDDKLSPTSPDSIFRRKGDPFADDFFLSLPMKSTTVSNGSNDLPCTNGFETDFNNAEIYNYSCADVFKSETT